MEFLRPLTDLQVKEKEMARFECEISKENAKVCDYLPVILDSQITCSLLHNGARTSQKSLSVLTASFLFPHALKATTVPLKIILI